MTTSMSVAEVLDRGAALIEQYGHLKHSYGDNSRGYCFNGAMTVITGSEWSESAMAAWKVLRRTVDRPVIDWNDAPGQTKENVIATMRACAAIWRAKHEESANVASVESSAKEVVNA